jgi:hypothetical protein
MEFRIATEYTEEQGKSYIEFLSVDSVAIKIFTHTKKAPPGAAGPFGVLR